MLWPCGEQLTWLARWVTPFVSHIVRLPHRWGPVRCTVRWRTGVYGKSRDDQGLIVWPQAVSTVVEKTRQRPDTSARSYRHSNDGVSRCAMGWNPDHGAIADGPPAGD
jgi:hypothetical protein